MVGWYHLLNGHELERTPGDSEGQGSLVCCHSWGHKESDMTEQLNNNKGGPKDWSFSFNISPSKEHSGLISFRVDWLDLLEVQGTLKSLLQHQS